MDGISTTNSSVFAEIINAKKVTITILRTTPGLARRPNFLSEDTRLADNRRDNLRQSDPTNPEISNLYQRKYEKL